MTVIILNMGRAHFSVQERKWGLNKIFYLITEIISTFIYGNIRY